MIQKRSRTYLLHVAICALAIAMSPSAGVAATPLFVFPVTYANGTGQMSVADLNGDGKLDLVAMNSGDGWSHGSVVVMLGNADGTFQSPRTYDSGGESPVSTAVADVNRDGKLDIVVANLHIDQPSNENGSVGVLLGNGDGTFQRVVTYPSGGTNAEAVAMADLNGDGIPDIVVGNCGPTDQAYCPDSASLDGQLGVLLGNGDGTFHPVVTYDAGVMTLYALAVADVNGDGRPDLVAPGWAGGGRVAILLGNGDGTFQSAVTYDSGNGNALSVAVADLNHDGKLDLALGSNYISVLLGNGDGSFGRPRQYPTGGYAVTSVTIADLNGDGAPDLAVASQFDSTHNNSGSAGVLLGNGDGTFQPVVDYYPVGKSRIESITAADLIGDGRPELLLGDSLGVTVLLNNSSPGFNSTQLATSGSPAYVGQSVTLTAVVRAHDGELVTFYDGTKAIGKGTTNNGTATFTTSSLKAGLHTITSIYPGDFDWKPSLRRLGQNVVKYSTATSLTSTPNPSNYGQTVTFTATFTQSGPYVPTAKVKFYDGTTSIGSVSVIGGVAKLNKSTLGVGTHSITAKYPGDPYNGASTSLQVVQLVQ